MIDGHGLLQRFVGCPWGGALLKLKVEVMVEEALEHLGASNLGLPGLVNIEKADGKADGKWWFNGI